jgi:hypothetical protein
MEQINSEIKNTASEIVPSRGPRAVKQSASQVSQPEVTDRKDLNYQWRKGKEIVRGRFVNDETPGGAIGFPFRKFKQDPIRVYKFKDQGIYEIPLCVAQHLNENCKTPIYGFTKDEEGNPVEIITGWKKRMHFESLEFSVPGGEEGSYSIAQDKPLLRERY